MTRSLWLLATLAVALFVPHSGSAATSGDEAEKSLQFFLGTWNCAHRVGDFSGTYVTTYSQGFGDGWLRQVYDFPATAKEPAVRAEYFLRYDDRISRWVRFGAHTNGMYFGMRAKDPPDTSVWSYTYVLPGGGADAIWTKKSDSEYTVDGPSYPENGKTVTEHHMCKKAP